MADDPGARASSDPGETTDKIPSGIPPASSSARVRVDAEHDALAEDGQARSAKISDTLVSGAKVSGAKVSGAKAADAEETDGQPRDARRDASATRPERRDPTPLRALRPPSKSDPGASADTGDGSPPDEDDATKRPVGLKEMTPSARLRLELAFDSDDDGDVDEEEDDEREGEGRTARVPRKPVGLRNMTTSARLRLELALEHDIDEETIKPPKIPSRSSLPEIGYIPFDDEGAKIVRSLARWMTFCGLITLAVGMLTGLSYLTGPGSVAHVVVGILATALSVWVIAAAWTFSKVLRDRQRQHHLVNAFGLLRSALLLKAFLLFSSMVLGCFTFSIGASLLLLL